MLERGRGTVLVIYIHHQSNHCHVTATFDEMASVPGRLPAILCRNHRHRIVLFLILASHLEPGKLILRSKRSESYCTEPPRRVPGSQRHPTWGLSLTQGYCRDQDQFRIFRSMRLFGWYPAVRRSTWIDRRIDRGAESIDLGWSLA